MTATLEPTTLRATAAEVMRRNGFQPDFPAEVMREVGHLYDIDVPTSARDLRALLWSSIDNRDSRDLDQVEVAEQLADGLIRVRIGVADVGALVPCGSPAD